MGGISSTKLYAYFVVFLSHPHVANRVRRAYTWPRLQSLSCPGTSTHQVAPLGMLASLRSELVPEQVEFQTRQVARGQYAH